MVIFLKKEIFGERALLDSYASMPAVLREAMQYTATFLCGLLLGTVGDSGALSPFGVCAVASFRRKYIFSSGLGAALGYILTKDSTNALRYIAGVIAAGLLSRLLCEFERWRDNRLMPSLITFFCCFSTGMAAGLASGLTLEGFLSCLAEAALGAGAAYFIASAATITAEERELRGLTLRTLAAASVFTFLLLLSLSSVAVLGVAFSRVAAVFLVLAAAYLYGEGGGAVLGIAAALIFGLSESVAGTAAGYAAGGLLAGLLAERGRLLSAMAFICTYGVVFLYTGDEKMLYLLIEAAAATVLFVALPKKYFEKAQNFFLPNVSAPNEAYARRVLVSGLGTAAKGVQDMARAMETVASAEKKKDTMDARRISARVQDKVCAACGLHSFCWDRYGEETTEAFRELYERLCRNETVTANNAPAYFSNRCIKLTSLCECFTRHFNRCAAESAAQQQVTELRKITVDQFLNIGTLLENMRKQLEKDVRFDLSKGDRLRQMAEDEYEIKVRTASCMTDTAGRMRVEIEISEKLPQISREELRASVSEICGRAMELPAAAQTENGEILLFCEKTSYKIESAATQITAQDEPMCGDSFESFHDGRGHFLAVLSDGMGTGTHAAVDSAIAAGLMSRLLRAGFDFPCALRLVNSALLMKSGEESLATLDILSVDLYTGRATLYKSGAAPSLIKRKNTVKEIRRSSLPAGILREAVFSKSEGKLESGDLLIMCSDGAFDISKNVLREALQKTDRTERTETVSQKLATAARAACEGARCDDISVLAFRITANDG